jgi:hypothetical protein
MTPQPLVEWLKAAVSVGADATQVNSVAQVLAQEDFSTVQEVCGQSGPNAGDLAELFPGDETIQAALMQAIKNRQSMEAWLRHHLPHGAAITPAACADTLQQEDFMSLTDLASAGLNTTDMAELFPEEPLVASSLLDALGKSTADTIGAAAPALTLPLASVSEQPSDTSPTAANGSLEVWLHDRLPSIDASACTRTFHREGFMNVDEVLTAGITRADLEELFPEWNPSTLTRLFEIIAEDGFTRKTPTVEPSRTTPVPDSVRTAPHQLSGSPKLELSRPAERQEPKQKTKASKRKENATRSKHSVDFSEAVMKRLPSHKLAGRPSIGAKIIVEFDDSCYKGKVISHCRDNDALFDCYFEEDGETWTLDANRHRYCLDNIHMKREKERRKTGSADASSSSRAVAKKPSKKRNRRLTADSDSDDDALTFKRTKAPAVAKRHRMSPERESLLERASSSPNIHRIIAQNAPLYNGCKVSFYDDWPGLAST